MANAYRDENDVPTLIALQNDGSTITRLLANPTTHGLKVSDGTGGSDAGNNQNNAERDDNSIPTFLAVSSTDGVTPVNVYCDSSGNLLVQST